MVYTSLYFIPFSAFAMPPEQQPLPPPPISRRPSSLIPRLKQKHQPPISFDSKESRRKHGRSSSFGGFVSRILPSRREERGHTLRSQYHDNGVYDATDVVFGTIETLDVVSHPARTVSESVKTNRARSCRPFEGDGEHPRPGIPVVISAGIETSQGPNSGRGISKGRGISRPFERLLGLRQELDRGDGVNLQDPYTTARHVHGEIQVPVSELGKAREIEATKTQQIFEDKKTRRENRRSLRDSGDFLGVQGANPRTGYWDVSTATSSSEPSQISAETRKRLDKEARDIEEKKRMLDEAQMKHQQELQRVQILRDQKKRENAEKKRLELKARQRRYGKWRASENGWSSVAEPDLSPIVQSLIGSPIRGSLKARTFASVPYIPFGKVTQASCGGQE